jgi:hypothetical protein
MIEDSAEEFLTASGGEGSFGTPSPKRCDSGGFARSHHNHTMVEGKAFVSSPWGISLNQLSHIPNSIFFWVNIYFSLKFFAKYFCGIFSEYTSPSAIMTYAMPDALTGHVPQWLHTLCSGSMARSKWVDYTTNVSQEEIS